MRKNILSVLVVSAMVFVSCSKNEGPTVVPVVAPQTYAFDRDGSTSVSFSGQTTRIQMAEELGDAMKDPSKTDTQLDMMFNHAEGNADFSDAALNSSSKNVRSKIAASSDYFASNSTESNSIKADFDGWIGKQTTEVFPNWGEDAAAGSAGMIQESGGGSKRYVNAKGLEYNQAYLKATIGALMADQMLNNYLSTNVLDAASNVADNDADVLASEKNYTTMEHKWDEAYGYLYGNETNPAVPELGADDFLNKYLAKVDSDADFNGVAQDIYDAFKLGRAAIVAKDYELRDAQANIIRDAVSKVIAVRAVHYLQAGKASLGSDMAGAFHDLSEGYGFVYSLRFTRNTSTNAPHLPSAEITAFLSTLMEGNGFWDVTGATLDQISDRIASAYGFTKEETVN
jgi:hypothetical protein